MKLHLKKSISVILSTGLTLLVIEMVFRVYYPQIHEHDALFQSDERLGWTFIANTEASIVYPGEINHYVSTNNQGFRDDDFLEMGTTKSLMVIGDSFVSNIAVENDVVFTKLMEKSLPDIDVLNLGVNGYGQVQQYLMLEQWLPKIRPDMVVQVIYLRNDFNDNVTAKTRGWEYPRPYATVASDSSITIYPIPKDIPVSKRRKGTRWYHHLHLYHFVRTRLENIQKKSDKESKAFRPPELDICATILDPEIQTQYKVLQQLLLKTRAQLNRQGISYYIVLAPSIVQVQDVLWEQLRAYDPELQLIRDLPNQILLEFAAVHDLKMLDLLPILREAETEEMPLYYAFEQHWTAEGNRVVAKAIADFVVE